MPNNGIVSKKTNIPTEFRASSISEFNNITDMVVINKPTTGINVEQKSVTLNQLAGLVGGGESGPQGPIGPQGPAGPAVPSGLDWKGEYNSLTAYELNDVVLWTNPDTDVIGSYWVTSTEGITGVAPTDNSGVINEGWAFLASQGPQGIQGPVGPQGEAGVPGSNGVASVNNLTGAVTIGTSTLETTSTSWNLSFTESGNDIKVAINKPYKEFVVKYSINGPGSIPNAISLAQNTLINEIGATQSDLTASYAAGTYTLNLPVGTITGSNGDISIVATESSTNFGNTWMYNFKTNFSVSADKINFKVYQWDQTTGTWLNNLANSTYVTVLLQIRIYNV
jgi:hypothetical protein